MQNVPPANGVAGNAGHDGLGQAANLNLEVQNIEASNTVAGHLVITDVPIVAANLLVAPGAEGVRARASQDDCTYRDVITGPFECIGQLKKRLRPKGVASLGAIDRYLRDAFSDIVEDVLVLPNAVPRR